MPGHTLSIKSARSLGEALRKNSTLERLSFGDERFGDDGLAALVAGIGVGSSLQCLDLELRGLGAPSATRLGAVLASPQKAPLVELILGRNRLGENATAFAELLGGLCAMTSMTKLDLSSNLIDSEAAANLEVLNEHAALCTLHLDSNPIGPSAPIPSLIPSLPSLRTLVLEGCALGDSGISALATILQSTNLTDLDLSKNDASALSMAALAQGLNASLRVLRCSENPDVGDQGSIIFAESIARAPLLQLNWSRNGATGVGAAALVQSQCTQGLVLLGNTIGDDGASVLAASLKDTPSPGPSVLKELDLTGAGFSVGCLEVLLPALKSLDLSSVVLGGNKIGAEGRELLDAFEKETGVSVAYDVEADPDAADGESKTDTLAGAVEATAASSPSPELASSPQWIGKPPPTPEESMASASAVTALFSVGNEVEITGLATMTKYNGLKGIISSELVNGRYSVWIVSESKAIAVKPENIHLDVS